MNTNAPSSAALAALYLDTPSLVRQLNSAFGPTLVSAMSGSKDTKAPIRWAKEGAVMRAEPERNLRFAHRILTLLGTETEEQFVRAWFVSSNPLLGEDSPIDAIRDGRHREVSEAAQHIIEYLKHGTESAASSSRITDIGSGGTSADAGTGTGTGAETPLELGTAESESEAGGDPGSSKIEARLGRAIVAHRLPQLSEARAFAPAVQTSVEQQERTRASATMRDVAEQAGVSIKTVSNVVNGSARVSTATRQRVETAVHDLGYQVNVTARSLRQGRTGMIGLVVPELRVPYFAELAYSVLKATEAHGLALLIEQTGPEGEHEADALRSPRRKFTDGLLFSPVALDPSTHPELDVDYPLVLLGERVFDTRFDHVTMANVEAAQRATEYLASLGRTHIAVLGYHPNEVMGSAKLRYDGYRQGLTAAGLIFDERLLGAAGRWVRSTGYTAMIQVLDSGAPIDAVFAMNDALALGALHALHARGLRVPEDVAVIGFDDIEDAQYSDPPLSSIDPGRDEIAERAVSLLVAKIAGEWAEPQRVIAEFSLVERASTAG